MNDYEKACQRFERINRDLKGIVETAHKMILDAYDEWDAAQENLRQYEEMPGIPKKEYDEFAQPLTIEDARDIANGT